MARFRYSNQLFLPIMLGIPILACQGYYYPHADSPNFSDHHWLVNKKIFIDPGRGTGDCGDRFRVGPNSVSEAEVNLDVARIMSDMLRTAGARVELSRTGYSGRPDRERARMARDFGPDLLVSIRHAASLRTEDPVNHPCVLIWGSRDVQPASYDFARLLIGELNAIADCKGTVISDFALFSEGGSEILRETRNLCPAAIGVAGFYSDIKHSIRLQDPLYLEKEAEAYCNAISMYFKWGTPAAEVHFSCPVDKSGRPLNLIRDRKPVITINTRSGNELSGIEDRSLRITLDGVPVGYKKCSDNSFRVNYGKQLYPGFHRLRFHFRNLRHQSSMILSAPFTVEAKEGDYDELVKNGRRLVRRRWTAKEGLKMLCAALSLGATGPESCGLVRDISLGFSLIGNRERAKYFSSAHSLFYADGCRAPANASDAMCRALYVAKEISLPVEYRGMQVRVEGDVRAGGSKSGETKNNFSGRLKQFFSRQE
ncbi:MAG: N-acetylmuramoyl-L-alanine amidase [Spirochaetes bacterium]|nr:N-acetylmuramoyl-L-alanine amidase [Spirochaetota bacterium]